MHESSVTLFNDVRSFLIKNPDFTDEIDTTLCKEFLDHPTVKLFNDVRTFLIKNPDIADEIGTTLCQEFLSTPNGEAVIDHSHSVDDGGLFLLLRKITLLLGSTMTIMSGASIAPSLPQIRSSFEHVPYIDVLVKTILTIPALFIVFCAPVAGILIDRFGRKPMILVSIAVYVIAGSSGFILESLPALIAGRALLGVAVAGTMVGFTTLIADYFSGVEFNKMMGLQSAFMGFGGVLFLIASGLLAEVSWRHPFLIYQFGLIVMPGVLLFCNELHKPQTLVSKATPASQRSTEVWLPRKSIINLYIVTFFSMVMFYMVPVQMPFYLKSVFNISNSKIGITLASMSLSFSLMSVFYQRIKKSFSFSMINFLGYFLMGTGYFLFFLAEGYNVIFTGIILSGIGMGLFLPNVNVWLVSNTPTNMRGRVIGGLSASMFLGHFFSPIIIQPFIWLVDISGSYALAGGLAIILSFYSFLLFRPKKTRKGY